jgi:hypothetical protein
MSGKKIQCSSTDIVDLLRTQLNLSLESQKELYEKVEDQSNQINFLLAFINQGNTMNKNCLKKSSRCQYSTRDQKKIKTKFYCTLCQNAIRRRDVSLHACSLDDNIDCICQTCYEKQYPISEDTDDDNGNDDDEDDIE